MKDYEPKEKIYCILQNLNTLYNIGKLLHNLHPDPALANHVKNIAVSTNAMIEEYRKSWDEEKERIK